jgi:predicted double-glycine peptidase
MTFAQILRVYVILSCSFSVYGFNRSKDLQPDNSCGPRCIEAILRLNDNDSIGVADIYNIIEKDPFQLTTLKDLKNAAMELGFTAEGYKATIGQLREYDGYLILPIMLPGSDRKDPYHYILAQNAAEDHIHVIDTKTLKVATWPFNELDNFWSGYVLVINGGKNRNQKRQTQSLKEIDENKAEGQSKKRSEIVKDFGTVESGSLLTHTFKIEDKKVPFTDAKIIKRSCSCLEAKLFKSQGEVFLVSKLRPDMAGSQSAYVDVSLEPQKVIKRYILKTYCIDHYIISPKIAYLEAPGDGLVECPVKIEYYSDKKGFVKLSRIENNKKGLKVRKTGSEVSNEENGAVVHSFKFSLQFDSRASNGLKHDKGKIGFVFETSNGLRLIPLEFISKICSEKYELVPSKLFVLVTKDEPITRKCTIEFHKEPFPERIEPEFEAKFPFKIQASKMNVNKYVIKLTLDQTIISTLAEGMNEFKLYIIPHDGIGMEKIHLPVNIFVPNR